MTFLPATGPCEGAIVNELFNVDEGPLVLRFHCCLRLRGKEPQAEQASMVSDKVTLASRSRR